VPVFIVLNADTATTELDNQGRKKMILGLQRSGTPLKINKTL
jgi:hypothetical protein